MNGLFFDLCWILGGSLAALVLHKGFSAGWFTVTKQTPVRINPAWRVSPRAEVVTFQAMKGPRKLRAGQSRRPL